MALRTQPRPPRRLRKILTWGLYGCGTLTAALLLAFGYFWFSTELPSPQRLRAHAARGSTRILDRYGQLLYQIPDPLGGRQQPVPLDEIPLALRQATIAVEDRNFYHNPGIDLRGMARAIWTNLRSGDVVAGGSTITQQLARNFLLDPQVARQRSLIRKLRETVLALKLTATCSKDEILALYLNQTYYGGMAYGVEAAAQHFFGKPVRDLDLAESAMLAGLPQAPSRYDPLNGSAALATAQARQSQVLDAMVRSGYLTPAQADAARAEPLQFAAGHAPVRAPHFVHYVIDQLAARFGPEVVVRGGLTVTTTLDADLQDTAQTILQRQVALLSTPRNGGPDHRVRNGAVVVLDPSDGAILALVGSPNFDDAASQGQVNAALARRQPGSAIKPLTYAAALERGWTAATSILDIPAAFQTREGRLYKPQNYDRTYHGPISLRQALATSSNVAAVRTLDAIGLPALLEMASRLGITTLGQDSGRYGLSLTLGGGEVTPLELTAAYAAFASGGQRVEPYAIMSVSGARQEGKTRKQVLSPQIAYLISDILSDRYARMRAFGAQSALDIDRPAAVKTGTTSDWRDNWTIGYTPDRVVGVWVGNADGQPMEAISGVSGAGPVWHEVMLAAHRGLPARPFERPAGIVEVPICAEGGKLPAQNCPVTRLERFIAGTQPTQADDTHIAVRIDAVLGCRAPQGYPAERTTTRIFRVLPPEAQAWAVSAGWPQPPRQVCPLPANTGQRLPPGTAHPADKACTGAPSSCPAASQPACRPPACNAQPAVLSPAPGATFTISPGIPRERQQIMLQASAGEDTEKLIIYVDDQPVAALDRPPYRALWQLVPGRHRVWVEVRDAQGKVRRSETVAYTVMD